jgi:hypothetical protein
MTFSFGRFNVILMLSNGDSTLGEVYFQIGESLCHCSHIGAFRASQIALHVLGSNAFEPRLFSAGIQL